MEPTLTVRTAKKREVVDITEQVRALVPPTGNGLLHLFVQHTTAALSVADLDPGTDLDMLDAFEHLIPKLPYRHPHDPIHVPDHILAALIGPALSVPVRSGEIALGTWQRIVMFDFNGPRERTVALTFVVVGSETT